MLRKIIWVFLTAITFSHANAFTTKELLDMCESDSYIGQSACGGYIVGITDGSLYVMTGYHAGYTEAQKKLTDSNKIDHEKIMELAKKSDMRFVRCIEGKATDQLMAIFIKWAKANPEKWDQFAAISIPAAFLKLCV